MDAVVGWREREREREREKKEEESTTVNTYLYSSPIVSPGSFFGFLSGTNAQFRRSARGAPKIRPLASKPATTVTPLSLYLSYKMSMQ